MRLAVLGSGSRGNAIAVRTEQATLLVDAGFGPRALGRRAARAGIDLAPLVGIVLTHEHQDHARGALQAAATHGCPVYASAGTIASLPAAATVLRPLPTYGRSLAIGPFTVMAARIAHDASEPVAVSVADATGRKIGIAYDLGRPTAAVRHLLRGCAALVLEANHDEVMLQTGPYPAVVRHRIAGTLGHLSNRSAAELAAEVCSDALEAVILVHVSEQNNDTQLARRTVARALRARRFRGRLLVAAQDDPLPALSLSRADQLTLSLPEAPPRPPPAPPRPAPTPGSSA